MFSQCFPQERSHCCVNQEPFVSGRLARSLSAPPPPPMAPPQKGIAARVLGFCQGDGLLRLHAQAPKAIAKKDVVDLTEAPPAKKMRQKGEIEN